MNFQDLLKKLNEMDTPPHDSTESPLSSVTDEENLKHKVKGDEKELEECGMPMPMPMGDMAPKQQDSVNMNVSINASGSGGIKDLMNILRNIEHGEEGPDQGVIIDKPEFSREIEMDEFANEPDEMYADVDDVANRQGSDLHKSKQMYKHSYRQGDNPMTIHVHEQLVQRLGKLYQTIKESK
jgi:hypothetical protein